MLQTGINFKKGRLLAIRNSKGPSFILMIGIANIEVPPSRIEIGGTSIMAIRVV